MALDMAKFLARFVEEARDHIEKLNNGLVHLEKNPDDGETINSIFRSAHTIKGSSRMMKLTSITEVAHKMEDVLGALREKKIKHSKELADLLFKGIDAVTEMINMTAAGQAVTADYTSLCDELARRAAEGIIGHPSPLPSPAGGEGTTIYSPPLRGGDEGEGEKVFSGKDVIPEKTGIQISKGPDSRQVSAQGRLSTETVRISSEKLDN